MFKNLLDYIVMNIGVLHTKLKDSDSRKRKRCGVNVFHNHEGEVGEVE